MATQEDRDAGVPGVISEEGLPELSVSGNRLVQHERSKAFNFHGVNRDSLEWGRYNWGGCGGDGHFTDSGRPEQP
jgi:hypothetical protein